MSGFDCDDVSHCECVDSLYERIKDLESILDCVLESWVLGIQSHEDTDTYNKAMKILKGE